MSKALKNKTKLNDVVTTNVAIKLTPTITGANGGTASFTGTIDMLWSGWSSAAPSLLLSGQATP